MSISEYEKIDNVHPIILSFRFSKNLVKNFQVTDVIQMAAVGKNVYLIVSAIPGKFKQFTLQLPAENVQFSQERM
jgi:hypothetical protein